MPVLSRLAVGEGQAKWSTLTHVVTTHPVSLTEAVQRSTSTDGAVSGNVHWQRDGLTEWRTTLFTLVMILSQTVRKALHLFCTAK